MKEKKGKRLMTEKKREKQKTGINLDDPIKYIGVFFFSKRNRKKETQKIDKGTTKGRDQNLTLTTLLSGSKLDLIAKALLCGKERNKINE